MRFLVVNTDYTDFLVDLYKRSPGLADAPFEAQMGVRMATLFGVADFYSRALRELGHEAVDIHANNEAAQRAWAREHGVDVRPKRRQLRMRRGWVPWVSPVQDERWKYQILEAQIRFYRPDVLLNQAMDDLLPDTFAPVRSSIRQLVGQHAATPLPESSAWSIYDVAISSFPPTVDWLTAHGVPAKLNRLAFDPHNRQAIAERPRDIDVSFVGSFFNIHGARNTLLNDLASTVPLKVWGPPLPLGLRGSALERCYVGPAWGRGMYDILARSRITLNHHGNIPPYANNLRLFEATGMGALLVTDQKDNLREMFEPGREVAAYRTTEECAQLIHHYLTNETDRAAVARAGQLRTLSSHTYLHRMRELVELLTDERLAGRA